jgi:ABC-2 type transport system ATP-binding protein
MADSMIDIMNLEKRFGDTEAVRGVSFTVEQGEFFGLLGPNGAGKTTTVGMLCGLIEPTSGSIAVGGMEMRRQPGAVKKRLGFVPQDLAFYPTLTARDNLAFFGRLYGLWGGRLNRRIDAVLKLVQLAERADEAVKVFSNGMKRRLNIAIGLLHEPAVLVLDEPTVGVDAQSRNAILENLDALSHSGMTVIYTTHYMEEAQRLCRRVAIMDRGLLIALDTPSALIRRLGEGLVRMRLANAPDHAVIAELQAAPAITVVDARDTSLHLTVRAKEEALRVVLDIAVVRKLTIQSLDILEPNLESVFLNLTGRHLRD